MPGKIVVVKRPRGGPFAVVRNWPTWWRAFWLGERLRDPVPGESDPTSLAEPLAGELSRPDGTADATPPRVSFDALEAAVRERGGALTYAPDGLAAIDVEPGEALAWLRFLREAATPSFDVLFDLTALDRWPAAPRFEAIYRLRSSDTRAQLMVRVRIAEDAAPAAPASLDSVASLWPSADWLEREVHELFGLRFRGHPGLQPLLLEPGFDGHPLRRDFVSTPDGADCR